MVGQKRKPMVLKKNFKTTGKTILAFKKLFELSAYLLMSSYSLSDGIY